MTSVEDAPKWIFPYDTNFKGNRGTWRIVLIVRCLFLMIGMFLTFGALGCWPSRYPETAEKLLPAVKTLALETIVVTYSYTSPTVSEGLETFNVESSTTTNYMANTVTSAVTSPQKTAKMTTIGTWYRGTKPPGFFEDVVKVGSPCSVGESYKTTETGCSDYVEVCVHAGAEAMRCVFASCLIYVTTYFVLAFENAEGKSGETLRFWRFVYLLMTFIAFLLAFMAESRYKKNCGDNMERSYVDDMVRLKAINGTLSRYNGRSLDIIVASGVFGAISFVIGVLEWIVYYRRGKKLGEGDINWHGESSLNASHGIAETVRAPPVSPPEVIWHGESSLNASHGIAETVRAPPLALKKPKKSRATSTRKVRNDLHDSL